MATFQMPGTPLDMNLPTSTAPLIVLFERDDAIAVPLLSQLRMAGYDVRAARTPVELFDITGKQAVALVLVDLGKATAGRREFWVALDAQRRGRPMQVMTFRYNSPGGLYDMEFESSSRAIADVEVHGTQEFQLIIEGVRQRVPLNGVPPVAAGMGLGQPYTQPALQPGAIAPIGAALGVPSPFMYQQSAFQAPAAPLAAHPYYQQGVAGDSQFATSDTSSPFANPSTSNPFIQAASDSSFAASDASPFAQPYSSNPFASEAQPETSMPTPPAAETIHAFKYQAPSNPPVNAFEERAARLSDAYAAEFGISDPGASSGFPGSLQHTPGQAPAIHAIDSWNSGNFFDSGSRSMAGIGTNTHQQYAPSMSGRETPFSDAWTPPESDGDWQISLTSVPSSSSAQRSHASFGGEPRMDFTPTEYAPALAMNAAMDTGMFHDGTDRHSRVNDMDNSAILATAPIPAPNQLPAARAGTPTEQTLGSVLVEGSLLSEKKLETLQGVQQMLSDVNMDFKLGELALLFKFLSSDQLLAALLVSRGLVSPQRIASLGRAKQDLANSGMDFNLADLLIRFQILPEEQLRRIQSEIAL